MDYKKSGVDIEAGYQSVELMKEHVKKMPTLLLFVPKRLSTSFNCDRMT